MLNGCAATGKGEELLSEVARPERSVFGVFEAKDEVVIGREEKRGEGDVANDRGQEVVEIVRYAASQEAELLERLSLAPFRLVTLPFSWQHADGSVMLILADWAQRIMTLRPVEATTLAGLPWPYLVHIVFGMTIFLLFPFSRLVHVWSGFATVSYLFRPHQVVRSRRLNVPAGNNQPRGALFTFELPV